MTLVRYAPFNPFDRFNSGFNRFFTSTRLQNETGRERNWMPAVDIREEDDRFVLYADIPGVAREDVDITLEDGVLTVKGDRRAGTAENHNGFQRRERMHGTFMRRFTLPDTVNDENISATVKDGVLQIEIPKQAKPEVRKVTIA